MTSIQYSDLVKMISDNTSFIEYDKEVKAENHLVIRFSDESNGYITDEFIKTIIKSGNIVLDSKLYTVEICFDKNIDVQTIKIKRKFFV